MSNLENVNIQWQDTGNIDAFGRARVSQVTTQFDAKQLHDNLRLFIDEETIGTGAAAHSTTEARSQLTTAATSDVVILQTKQRFNYQSGKSQLVFMTFDNFQAETNITKRIGYFSSSTSTPFTADLDGLFLESDGDVSINIYKSGTLTEQTDQSSWNIDPLDGSGESGITVDWQDSQILIIDFEWLGVGRVRWGLVIDGLIVYFHESNHANSTSGVYMSSPNQPLRWELRQSGAGSGTFNVICSSVNSEGSLNKLGKILSENLGTTHVNANSTSNKYALLGLRLQTAKVDTLVDLINYSILSTTSDDQLIEVWLNPTVAGTFTFNSVTNSSVQVAKGAADGSNTVTGGTLLYSRYITAQDATPVNLQSSIRLGMAIDGTLDEIVITCNPLSNNSDVLASIDWRELA